MRGDIGPQGPPGERGPPGPPGPSGGGVIYTRWGRTICPNTTGTTLLYSGRAGGSHYQHSGGGANYLCLPDDPQYLSAFQSNNIALVYGAEYDDWVGGLHDHNVPCAVCHASTRSSYLLYPARPTCPASWTREYFGYLTAERQIHANNKAFECMDNDPERVPGGTGNQDGALFRHTKAKCLGLQCPPYTERKVLTCAVCTK